MDCVEAYQELEELGVTVGSLELEEFVALSKPEGFLAIDYSKIEGEAHELEVLLHEIGHFAAGAFYQTSTPLVTRERQEYKATRFVFEKYYPPEVIAEVMASGCAEPWKLADALNLPERFVREMLLFYTEARGIDFNVLVADVKKREAVDESAEVAALLDELARTRGIHMFVADNATVNDVETALRMINAL